MDSLLELARKVNEKIRAEIITTNFLLPARHDLGAFRSRTLGWGGSGYDGLFFIARDLLAHRKVRMLVFYDEDSTAANCNPTAVTWFRFGENGLALAGLPLADKALFILPPSWRCRKICSRRSVRTFRRH